MKKITDNTNNLPKIDLDTVNIAQEIIKAKKESKLKSAVGSLIFIYIIITILNMAIGMNLDSFLSMFIGSTIGVLLSAKASYMKSTKLERAILKQYKKEQKEKSKNNTKSLTKSISANKDIKEIENMIDREFEVKSLNLRNRTDDIKTLKEFKNMLHNDLQNNDIVKKYVKK